MASPFHYFRKHQKVFMAAAVVLCMVIFVFASAINPTGGSAGGRADSETVVTWHGGSLKEGELRNLVYQRRILNDFLIKLYSEGVRSLGYQETARVPDFRFNQQLDVVELEFRVINTEVTADVAEEEGLSVSDAVINNYLREWGLRQVGGSGIRAIISSLGRGDVARNEAVVFETLRKLLLAYYYDTSMFDASATVTPLERWHDWQELNRRVSVEAAILPAADFVDQTSEPSDEQLLALYEQYKDQPPEQYSRVEFRSLRAANPGFAEPMRIRLQYLRGSVADWTERMRDTVTEEEIETYYEVNKRTQFVESSSSLDEIDVDFEALENLDEPTGDESDKEMSNDSDQQMSAESGEDDGAAAPAEPTPDAEAAGGDVGDDADEPAAASEATAPPAADASAGDAEEEAADDVGDDADDGQAGGQTSQMQPQGGSFRLVNFQAEGDAADDADGPTPDAETPESTAAEPAAEADDGDESAAATEASAGGDEVMLEADEAMTDDAASTENEVRYTPLEEVRESIRDRLAEDKAYAALPKQMNTAFNHLQLAFSDYMNEVIDAQEKGDPAPDPPVSLTDLQPYAEQYDLLVENTGLFTYRQLRQETLVGQAINAQTSTEYVADAVTSNSLRLYEPYLAKDLAGDWYLIQKTEVSDYYVPEFADVRSQVIRAWKQREAAKLAEAKAQELAAQLGESGQSFEAFFADKAYETIGQTEMFSRKTLGLVGQNQLPMISSVAGLNNVGPKLLDAVFALKDNEAAGALNYDHSEAYVVQIRSREMTDDELRELFLATANSWQGRPQTTLLRRNEFEQTRLQRLQEQIDLNLEPWQESRQKMLAERE